MKLHEGSDDDLKARMVKKKKKTLGTINITLVMEPMSKEEYNEVTYIGIKLTLGFMVPSTFWDVVAGNLYRLPLGKNRQVHFLH